ncbi:endonuclease/exonuclease/phosphatase family protein [Vibrio sp. YMD68]|uniref:endonuclease/exonuclease/phosphatase family protein n=1 Tax=Vibrio sp. YMD68 TaxID=3042300 RepID=UPI00249A2A32|nr:endonuclease/exonuclease/phosphatase family protein [Vibrio sp. YMD68]WGV99650.1 endonuclease/exonuclease/phosphatase family protein [Vibrio sp. YMD68]
MNRTHLFFLALVLSVLGFSSVYFIFSVSTEASVTVLNTNAPPKLQCHQELNTLSIDNEGQLDVLVWNIYKQNRPNWHEVLTSLSQSRQLILLQEASMTDSFKGWLIEKGWQGNQVEAFKALDVSSGVLTIATESPSLACAYLVVEPWLRLPKSALFSLYSLSDGQQLAVVNIHAVNFTYGVVEYQQQLDVLAKALLQHEGPIIFAGDFNSWSHERMDELAEYLQPLGLVAASFRPDNRKQFVNGLALDHIFYRGLTLKKAEAPHSDASDHNPLLVSFSL